MKKFNNIINELNNSLDVLESETDDSLSKAEKGIHFAKEALLELRKLTLHFKFKSEAEEILFFKQLKPSVYSKIIYYVKLFNIESKRPRGTSKTQKNISIMKLKNYKITLMTILSFIIITAEELHF